MKERIIIVIIAVVLGLAATTLGFFIYQSTKIVPDDTSKSANNTKVTPSPIDLSKLYVTVDEPKNNILVQNRTIQVKGKTNPDNTLLISTNQEDVVAKPTNDGTFSVSITIDAGTNRLITRVISPTGDEKSDSRVVSFSTTDLP